MKEIRICCLCGRKYVNYGNNAQPIKEGRCCDSCNNKVIAERIRLFERREELLNN